jgi:hypothetical protein
MMFDEIVIANADEVTRLAYLRPADEHAKLLADIDEGAFLVAELSLTRRTSRSFCPAA